MKRFLLSTDSCSDVFKSELRESNIFCAPMAFIINDSEYRDTYDSNGEYRGFYDQLRTGCLPKTTQLNPVETAEFFESIFAAEPEGDLIHISLSSGLSSTAANAKVAAEEIMRKYPGRKIFAIDSLSATQGQRYILDRAREYREAGRSAEETVQYLNDIIPNLHHFILVKDLFHLKRGGRVTAASAAVGSLLGIRPILVINHEGKLVPVDKVKGSTKSLKYMVKSIKKHGNNATRAYIAHADDIETAEELKSQLIAEGIEDVTIGYIGPVIGSHTGAGTIGLVFVGDKRPEINQK